MMDRKHYGIGARVAGLAAVAAAMLSLSSAAWAQYGSSGTSGGSGAYGDGANSVPNTGGATPSTGRSGSEECMSSAGMNNPNCPPSSRSDQRGAIPDRSGASSGSSGMGQDRNPKQPLPQSDK